ncbi:MAG: DNA polymerase IV [Gemmatimonadetes bacterium]|nr:DNA polymerase IV [Gemmatimonadota bacterium]
MPTPVPRRILLADADAFYVSIARLVDPAGAGQARLLIVGGSAEGRGVVLSASYEARAHGVHSAMPMARALRLCPDATVAPVPWEACTGMGREIRHVLERFTPIVQQASIDEFYLDLSGTERLYHDEPLPETARRIRAAVLEATGLSLSIGGGSSRLVAKMAAGIAKPGPDRAGEGVHVVPDGDEIAFMRRFALADIPGVGPKTAVRLARVGLRAVNDVLALELPVLKERLGKGREGEAVWLIRRARGLDRTPVEHRLHNKSISRDETFGKDLDADADLARELAVLVDRATADLRGSGLLARTITVKLRDWDFTTRQARRTLREPVLSDRVVYGVARALLARLRASRRVPARLVGVALSGLMRDRGGPQLELFARDDRDQIETGRDETIARVLDTVRDRFGRKSLRRGWT